MPTQLPLFPLPNVVLFPGIYLPLHIFEERYRQMIHDVLDHDARFGIQLCQEYNPETLIGKPFDVGTVAEIVEVNRLDDGRMNIVVMGGQRFRVMEYDDSSKPYLQGQVTWLEDVDEPYIPKMLLEETTMLLQEALRLSHKILKTRYEPEELPDLALEAMTFYIADNLRGSLVLKQQLLEMTSPLERLQYEREVLEKIVRTLAVRAQIEDAFQSS